MSTRVWIVLPAYNEAANLPALFEGFRETFDETSEIDASLIIIDDGSTDDTFATAQRAPKELRVEVLQNERNMGLGETFKRGMLHAAGLAAPRDIIVSLDADGSHLPGLILRMVRMIREGRDVVIASRYQPGAIVRGVPLSRQALSGAMSMLFRTVLPIAGVRDFSCGYRAYRAEMLQRAIAAYGDTLFQQAGFACMVDVLVKLGDLGALIGEVPVVLRYDLKRGASKLPVANTVAMTLGVLARERVRRFTRGRAPPRAPR